MDTRSLVNRFALPVAAAIAHLDVGRMSPEELATYRELWREDPTGKLHSTKAAREHAFALLGGIEGILNQKPPYVRLPLMADLLVVDMATALFALTLKGDNPDETYTINSLETYKGILTGALNETVFGAVISAYSENVHALELAFFHFAACTQIVDPDVFMPHFTRGLHFLGQVVPNTVNSITKDLDDKMLPLVECNEMALVFAAHLVVEGSARGGINDSASEARTQEILCRIHDCGESASSIFPVAITKLEVKDTKSSSEYRI